MIYNNLKLTNSVIPKSRAHTYIWTQAAWTTSHLDLLGVTQSMTGMGMQSH